MTRQFRTHYTAAALQSGDDGIDAMVERHLARAGIAEPAAIVVVEPHLEAGDTGVRLTTYSDFDERYTARSIVRGTLKVLGRKLGLRE